jgi:hypothetical protein
MTSTVPAKALEKIIDYLWDAEKKSYLECCADGGSCGDHIFEPLTVVQEWLDKQSD